MENKKNILIVVCLLISVVVLTGCESQESQATQNTYNSKHIEKSDFNSSSDAIGQEATVSQNVSVDHRCIGCGKCARIASNTFVMEGHKAIVVSQEYASSNAVKQAAAICPVDAIVIIET